MTDESKHAKVVDRDEQRLLLVLRSIKKLDSEVLISREDASAALKSLEDMYDLDEREKEMTPDELALLVEGFVAGLASTRIPMLQELAEEAYQDIDYDTERPQYPGNAITDEDERTIYRGGPSGGTAVGQGEDPRYVTQTGVHDEPGNKKEDSGK